MRRRQCGRETKRVGRRGKPKRGCQIERLYRTWHRQGEAILYSSNTGDYVALPAYRGIVEGQVALPFLEKKLTQDRDGDFMLAHAVVEICGWDRQAFASDSEQAFLDKICANSREMNECPTIGQSLLRRSPRAGGKLQALGDVVGLLGERIGVVDPQRPKRRIPDQAGAGRGAERARIGDLLRRRQRVQVRHARSAVAHRLPTSENMPSSIARQQAPAAPAPAIRPMRSNKRCRRRYPSVVPGVMSRGPKPWVQNRAPVAARRRSVDQRQGLATPRRDVAALRPYHADHVAGDRMVIAHVFGRPREFGGAAEPGKVVVGLDADAVGRVSGIVERGIDHAVADGRDP